MKLLRILLFPIVPIYFLVTWLRNRLYDFGVKSSKSYNFPVICVGNLSTGGTGKTPLIEYLVRLLAQHHKVATLSRGYKRVTKGFLLADDMANVDTVGDEPFQFYNKFSDDIYVAVDENRQHGIEKLRELNPKTEVVLLDDAYQHRKVKAGFNILLTSYTKRYSNDMVLPTGNLREPKAGAKRADVIVVTKCPSFISEKEKVSIVNEIAPNKYQSVFFASIKYSPIVVSVSKEKPLESLSKFSLVTGIANSKPMVSYLKSKNLDFEHLEFGDHYNFTLKDIEMLEEKKMILTTEKDYMRLLGVESLTHKLYYLSIETVLDKPDDFNRLVLEFVTKPKH